MPQSIKLIERLVLASLGLGILLVADGYREASEYLSISTYVLVIAFTFALTLGLLLWMTRGRSKIAKWIWIVLYAVGLAASLPRLITESWRDAFGLLELVQYGLQGATIWLLFRPDAKAWFDRKIAPDTSVFD